MGLLSKLLEMRSWAGAAALCCLKWLEGEERQKAFHLGLGDLVSGPPGGATGVSQITLFVQNSLAWVHTDNVSVKK